MLFLFVYSSMVYAAVGKTGTIRSISSKNVYQELALEMAQETLLILHNIYKNKLLSNLHDRVEVFLLKAVKIITFLISKPEATFSEFVFPSSMIKGNKSDHDNYNSSFFNTFHF